MLRKLVAYGTTHNVEITQADKKMIIAVDKSINEAFILIGHGLTKLPKPGDKGICTFIKDQANGHWNFTPTQPAAAAEDLKEYHIVQSRQDVRGNTIVYLAPVLGTSEKISGYDVLIYKRQVSGVVTVAHFATGLYVTHANSEISARKKAAKVLSQKNVDSAIESSKNLLARHKIEYPVNT